MGFCFKKNCIHKKTRLLYYAVMSDFSLTWGWVWEGDCIRILSEKNSWFLRFWFVFISLPSSSMTSSLCVLGLVNIVWSDASNTHIYRKTRVLNYNFHLGDLIICTFHLSFITSVLLIVMAMGRQDFSNWGPGPVVTPLLERYNIAWYETSVFLGHSQVSI